MKTFLPLLVLCLVFAPLDSHALPRVWIRTHNSGYVQDGDNAEKVISSDNLAVANRGPGSRRKSYLAFALPPEDQAPPFGEISLNLAWNMIFGKPTGSFPIQVYGVVDDTTFKASTLTWNNAPHNDVHSGNSLEKSSAVIPLGQILVDTVDFPGTKWLSFSSPEFTAYVRWALGQSGDAYRSGQTGAPNRQMILILVSEGEPGDPLISFDNTKNAPYLTRN